MKKQNFITNQETEKCQKIAQTFNKFCLQMDILVLDTGKYGFSLMKYYDIDGFQCIDNYTNSSDLFNALWQEWLEEKLISLCCETPLINLDYEEMFKGLSKESQNEILETKKYFLSIIDNENTNLEIRENRESYITDVEKNRCRVVADLFRNDLEKDNIIIKDTEKYGYIMLQYYEPTANFDSAVIFTNSQTMFDTLLDEWFIYNITDLMREKQITNTDIDVFYDELPEEEKEKLKKKKEKFVEQARKKASFLRR